jgi:hypothetical protein
VGSSDSAARFRRDSDSTSTASSLRRIMVRVIAPRQPLAKPKLQSDSEISLTTPNNQGLWRLTASSTVPKTSISRHTHFSTVSGGRRGTVFSGEKASKYSRAFGTNLDCSAGIQHDNASTYQRLQRFIIKPAGGTTRMLTPLQASATKKNYVPIPHSYPPLP